MTDRHQVTIVVPCYNEARRFDDGALARLLDDDAVRLVLVDDGSTDDTRALLDEVARRRDRVRVVGLPKNAGKAEAVRAGMNAAIEHADIVGYYDADLATPPAEMLRIVDVVRDDPTVVAAIGARIARLGADIERSAVRHYAGRVFATAASLYLGVAVYDTQCGAKAFRVDAVLRQALSQPFTSSWIFDVELLDRLFAPDRSRKIVEVPLRAWRDVPGSKVSTTDVLAAAAHLARLAARRRRR